MDVCFHRAWVPVAPMWFRGQPYPPPPPQLISASSLIGIRPPLIELQQPAKSHCVDHNLSHTMFSTDGNNSIHTRSTQDRTENLIRSLPHSFSTALPKVPAQTVPLWFGPWDATLPSVWAQVLRKPLLSASQEVLCHPGAMVVCKCIGDPRWDMLHLLIYLNIGSAAKESACNVGDLGSVPGLGRSPGEEKGYPPQYSGLENSMDCVVHAVIKSQTWVSNFFTYLKIWSHPFLLCFFNELHYKVKIKTWLNFKWH